MKFPLYHRPSGLVFLDDEASYLEMLSIVLPRQWLAHFFTRMDDFKDCLEMQSQMWEDDLAQHRSIVNLWHAGKRLPRLILDYWATHTERYKMLGLCVVDYAMPAATGLDVLRDSPAWPAWRLLLTGKADEQIAVAAFNDGLIQRYVTKQSPDLAQQLIYFLRMQRAAPFAQHQEIWRNILRPSQLLALQDRLVQKGLQDWLKSQRCEEYFLLPEPFGILALDDDGQAHWLQFEMFKDLPAAVDLARAAGHSYDVCASIASGFQLSDVEWNMAMGEPHVKPQIAQGMALGTGGHLITAHFPLSLGTVCQGYKQFLQVQPARGVDLRPQTRPQTHERAEL